MGGNNQTTKCMEEKEKDAVQLPDNAFRELHEGEE